MRLPRPLERTIACGGILLFLLLASACGDEAYIEEISSPVRQELSWDDFPIPRGAESAAGWRFVGIGRGERHSARAHFRRDSSSIVFDITSHAKQPDGALIGRTPQFVIGVDSQGAPAAEVEALSNSFMDVLRDHEPTFTVLDLSRPAFVGGPLPPIVNGYTFLLLLAAGSSLFALLGWLSRQPRDVLIFVSLIAGVAVIGGVLRVVVPPWAPLHCNQHAVVAMESSLFQVFGDAHRAYGELFRVIPSWTTSIFGRTDTVLMGTLVFLSSLLPMAAAGAVAGLGGGRLAVLAAAVFTAVHPVLIRVAPADVHFVQVVWLLGMSLAFWGLFCRERRLDAWLAATFWTILAVQSRLFTVVFPVVVAGYILAAPNRDKRSLMAGAAGVGLAGLMAVFHVFFGLPNMDYQGGGFHFGLFLESIRLSGLGAFNPLVLHPGVTVWTIVLLFGAGVAALARAPRRTWFLLGILTASFFMFVVQKSTWDLVRYQAPGVFLFLLFAALGADAWRELPTRLRRAGMVVTGGLLILTLSLSPRAVQRLNEPHLDAIEFQFIQESVSELPADGVLFVMRMYADFGLHFRFPLFMLSRAEGPLLVRPIEDLQSGGSYYFSLDRPLIVYRPLSCHWRDLRDSRPLQSWERCPPIPDGYALRPLVTKTLPADGWEPLFRWVPHHFFAPAAEPMEIGFYEVVRE